MTDTRLISELTRSSTLTFEEAASGLARLTRAGADADEAALELRELANRGVSVDDAVRLLERKIRRSRSNKREEKHS